MFWIGQGRRRGFGRGLRNCWLGHEISWLFCFGWVGLVWYGMICWWVVEERVMGVGSGWWLTYSEDSLPQRLPIVYTVCGVGDELE